MGTRVAIIGAGPSGLAQLHAFEEARKQGAFKVVAAGGTILKRGHDLKQVLKVFDRQLFRLASSG